MKRSISDLLDDFQVDPLEVEMKTPLSGRSIKNKTMRSLNEKRTMHLRWVARVAAVAAVMMSLMLTVYAADMVLNDGKVVHKLFGKEMTEKQVEVVESIGREFHDSITANGTTITPIQSMADDMVYYLHLRVEAPEGVVLPDVSEEDAYYYTFEPRKMYYYNENGSKFELNGFPDMLVERYDAIQRQWKMVVSDSSTEALPDDDPTDNVKEFVLQINYKGWNRSDQFRVNIGGLYIEQWGNDTGTQLLSGGFSFDITINDENRTDMKLVVDAQDYSFYNEEYDYTTTVSKIIITPLRITVEHTHTEPNNKYIFPKGGPIQLVMKDGTVVDAMEPYYNAAAHEWPHPDSIVGVVNRSTFDVPVVVADIDYVLINGEHKIDVN
ncbi:MAG: hypothetical protein IJV82_05255 [Oscillospiraceae bacterium]|nr:hypothetical protein [Oscillospiraceae bacterium]